MLVLHTTVLLLRRHHHLAVLRLFLVLGLECAAHGVATPQCDLLFFVNGDVGSVCGDATRQCLFATVPLLDVDGDDINGGDAFQLPRVQYPSGSLLVRPRG